MQSCVNQKFSLNLHRQLTTIIFRYFMEGVTKIFKKDLDIAKAIMHCDVEVTMQYMYKDCYPMFKAFYNRYYTDCQNCREFIDSIYVLIMTPGIRSKKCPLSNFRGESSLKTWLRNATLTYCYHCFKKKINTVELPSGVSETEGFDLDKLVGSSSIDMTELNRMDEEAITKTILRRMPNKRYSQLLSLYMLDKMPHADIAVKMGMSMPNYYNKRKLAKDQYEQIKKELNYE